MKYYIIAGEASGDLHGSNLMKGLYAEDPSAQIRFWGGGLMSDVAKENGDLSGLVKDYREGAVMGIAEVIAKAGKIAGNLKLCKQDILEWAPDVVILIDYPGFNMKIAEFAHNEGLKVFYYIAPKTWASRERRNKKLKEFVDQLFIVFPFEIPYFSERNIPFIYRGNPLVDAVDNSPAMAEPKEAFTNRHGLSDAPSIAILAGSRKGEISRTMPVAMEAADKLHAMPEFAGYRFMVAGAPARSKEDYLQYIGDRDYVELIFGDTYGIVKNSEAAIINSGTASLEAALIGTPQLVVYSMNSITAFVGRHIFKVMSHIKFISLGNLIVDKLVFREFVQEEFTAANVVEETVKLLTDTEYKAQMLGGYKEIREALGGTGASRAVAAAMVEALR